MSINIWDFNCEFDVKSVTYDINYKYKNFSSQTNSLFRLPWFCSIASADLQSTQEKSQHPIMVFWHSIKVLGVKFILIKSLTLS